MGSTRPNPIHVGSGWTYVIGRVGLSFFLPTVGSKNPLNPTHVPPNEFYSIHDSKNVLKNMS